MAWESNMTTDQKEQYVIQLYTEGKTFKVIAQLTHTSFRDISAIIKRHQGTIEREKGQLEERDDDYDIKSKSKTTQAIKMFSENKNLVDVVIALDLPTDEVRDIYRQFLQLQDMHELVRVFDEMQNFLPSLLELFRLTISRGFDKNDIINLLWIINTGQLEYLKVRIQSRTDALNWLENEIKMKENYLNSLDYGIREVIPMTNSSANELTYRPDSIYPPLPDDTSIKPIPYMQD
jgi:hypothetical protein